MVLADLGRKINNALSELTKAPLVDEKVLDALLRDICAALLASDVNVMLVHRLRVNVKKSINLNELVGTNRKRVIQKVVMDQLVALVDPGVIPYKPLKNKANIIMMVGLQGAGKTTTCTKLASFYQRKGWKTALVCADTFRAGAFDQLKQNATKAKIPYFGSYTETDPVAIAQDGVKKFREEKFEIIIVDTSGRHKQESELFEEMKQISAAVSPDSTILVMDGTIGQAADGQARAFKEAANFGSIVMTKMDGHAKGGGAISAVAATDSPIVFIGTGEHMHDLDRFEPKSFIRKMLGMGDLNDFAEKVQELSLGDNKNLMKNIQAGEYSLRDMYEQFQQMSKMGPLSKLMGAIPGMPAEMLAGSEEEGGKRIKRMMCIMDSMTDKELDGDSKQFEKDHSRIIRVARGSGTSVHEVEEILFQYKRFAEMVKTMGGKGGLLNNLPTDPRKANPGQMASMAKMQQQMANMIPPQMMQQMGGMEGLQKMAKQMGNMFGGGGGFPGMGGAGRGRGRGLGGGGGGMPDMAQIMKAMKDFQ
ncbi:SRP54-type protein [Spinellus fusiger]|nr:SRP54-type protein [Spinellus fusiger]